MHRSSFQLCNIMGSFLKLGFSFQDDVIMFNKLSRILNIDSSHLLF
jgi:hypothetical protein